MRVKSSITEAIESGYKKKCPLLLPNELLFTNLIILFRHEQVYHGGAEITFVKYERNIG